MNALESPLEALAFSYLSFGFITIVNNVWTWVAVLTAAISFWRIKTCSTLPAPEPRADFSGHAPSPPPPTPTLVTSSMSSPSSQVERESTDQQATISTATTIMFHVVALTKEEGKKRKLTVYFKQDIAGGEYDGNGNEEGEDGGVELSKELFENWESAVKMRKGEMEWYSYQDMRVIDGSVVRLWDGCRRRRNAETTAFSVGVVSTS
ncbi:uncharacterized protein LOC107790985 [Nicotiana tabacum]|uniref:Uncharacterized protein LOC107790985 n=1 Tax=Nicotiana tabacum TaxID=4097 RepID=A0A1S3ZVK1_TOBAC|nr:uncharacterized protein LOC104102694 [Nicotiana tomentosiformis]XP_016468450.1 PREDICTED: uncharacterized protein LOC107790985 [Nicotiana tabacum]